MKKIFIFIGLFCLFTYSFNITINYNILGEKLEYANDRYHYQDLIFDSMYDVDDYIEWRYGSYPDFYYTTEHNYGLLATQNINQETLRDGYNNLGNLRHDLNHDNIINNLDNVGQNGGICQPTAVTMALRYMIARGDITYTPQLNNDVNDPLNVFYNVASAYIYFGWGGSGANTLMCSAALNKLFEDYFDYNNYAASYTASNLINVISTAFDNYLPAVAHISDNEGGAHAMTIAGYYTKHIHYLDDSEQCEEWDYPEVELDIHYVAVNTGWVDTVSYWNNITGPIPLWLYEDNYSFVNVNFLDGVTYICEIN